MRRSSNFESNENRRSVGENGVIVRSLSNGHSHGKIATIPIGYADGINRLLSNNMEVLIEGNRYPVVGRITMDMIMADVGSANINNGGEVVIYGMQGNQTISISEIAHRLNTIPYEICCSVSNRIPRIYVNS